MRLTREKRQKIKVLETKKDSSETEQSAYWDDVSANNRSDLSGMQLREHPCANPDILPETEIATPSTPQLLMGEAIEHLQGRQRECYFLTMREGKSFSETAEILGIGKGRVQQYRERAIKFITKWCEQQMAKGRV
jgi:RNA polymerase sigma factor (sigma-70 family)